MADSIHISKADLENLHKPGCLTRHQKRAEGNTCSHQWQAVIQTQNHASTYDHPTYHSLCVRSRGPTHFQPSISRRNLMKRPKCGEWNVGVGRNFQHFKVPYWHNAHHIIPNGSLRGAIAKAGKGDSRLPRLIKYALLKAEYNLNDKENMVILPMQSVVAEALGLPRHLRGDEVGPNEKPEMFSHQNYSDYVEGKLVPILNKYKRLMAEALKKEHLGLPGRLSRGELETLSMNTYIMIITTGSAASFTGTPLDDMVP